jgi:hypothetical protein
VLQLQAVYLLFVAGRTSGGGGINEITEIFGIEPRALTANETDYLIGFRTVDEIRNRLVKARQEINNRLSAKGVHAKI